jgi:RecA/RadA recombinase
LELQNGFTIKATPDHKILTKEGWKELRNINDADKVMVDSLHAKKENRIRPKLGDQYICQLINHPHAPRKNKSIAVHRLIYEAHINKLPFTQYIDIICNEPELSANLKYLDPLSVVHHKDGNHYNNSTENLELLSKEEHTKHHGEENFRNFHQGVPFFIPVKSVTTCGIEDTYDIICEEPHHNFVANGMIVHNCGKTQIGHILCVNIQKEDPDAIAVYIDTENTFRPSRLRDFARAAKLDEEKALKNVMIARAYNSDHQVLLAEKVEDLIKKGAKVKLLVVDSVTAHFRAEYIGRGTLADRQQKLNKHLHTLLKLADTYNFAVYVTNQVMAKPDTFFGDPTQPIGGHILGHASTTRIYLRKGKKGSRVAKLIDSPSLPDAEVNFFIVEGGLEDIKEKKKED